MDERICGVCGKSFVPAAGNQKYCSADCRQVTVREAARKQYAANRDQVNAYHREWRHKNREKRRAQARARYAANREKALAASAKWRKSEKGQRTEQNKHLVRRYGITLEVYEEMLAAQNGVCAICGGTSKERRLAVDHDAKTGMVRQLLCRDCNTGIGLLGHSPKRITSALEYLEFWNDITEDHARRLDEKGQE